MLDYFDLKKYFSIILGVDRVSAAKPSPEIIYMILDELDIGSHEAMMIGDSLFDLNAGKAAGTFTCSVTYGFEDKGVLEANHPDFLIDSFKELGALL
jgi:phosphoglycolate phosphatase-like HAD superfamily hydrolase